MQAQDKAVTCEALRAQVDKLRAIIGGHAHCASCGSVVPMDGEWAGECDCTKSGMELLQRLGPYDRGAYEEIAALRAQVETLRISAEAAEAAENALSAERARLERMGRHADAALEFGRAQAARADRAETLLKIADLDRRRCLEAIPHRFLSPDGTGGLHGAILRLCAALETTQQPAGAGGGEG